MRPLGPASTKLRVVSFLCFKAYDEHAHPYYLLTRNASMPSNSTNAKQVSLGLTPEAEAQQVLDELLTEKALPFALHVGKITKGSGVYTIHFHDSRVRTAQVELTPGLSFREMVRTSVLARVSKMSGPLARSMRKG